MVPGSAKRGLVRGSARSVLSGRFSAVFAAVGLAAVLGGAPAQAEARFDRSPSAGCGESAVPGTSETRTIVSGGITRSYLLHVPANYRQEKPTPVVLSFHGHSRTSEYQEELSGFSATDAIAVYPQGLVGTDGETAWQGAPYSAAADDVLFTGDLLDRLERDFCVDRARIYAAGKSNGGGFTGVLACRMSDRIAAFAPVSGAFYPQGGECEPERAAPILDFHGTADQTIPYQGNPEKGLPPIPEWLAGWADRNDCDDTPIVRDEGNGVQVAKWVGCDRNSSVVHYRIEGLGHDWPSTRPNPDSDQPSVVDATPIIMRFFAEHRLR
ncbi:polyhydroxybutyrate depolymerase [Saccharopolyspora shandongensis]|uniref:Polyhydroxybutyrate depolymerase n=1 Tax=Saccharopolyspora shandongensis TaxID=418495 RepID=A0A1H2WLV8_9PSEU|nr:polyhydroxybutyrate depolymerase [Saccharopolyspora shandongensis]